ncbi:MAG: MTH1187 family thiamine-binding protein [Dehalococcoidia bacterium]
MAIAEISVVPLGTKTPSVSKYVARAVKVLQGEKDVKYETTAMGTIVEADLDRVLAVMRKMHEAAFADGVARVVTTVKIDDRRDETRSMQDKLESLSRALQA